MKHEPDDTMLRRVQSFAAAGRRVAQLEIER